MLADDKLPCLYPYNSNMTTFEFSPFSFIDQQKSVFFFLIYVHTHCRVAAIFWPRSAEQNIYAWRELIREISHKRTPMNIPFQLAKKKKQTNKNDPFQEFKLKIQSRRKYLCLKNSMSPLLSFFILFWIQAILHEGEIGSVFLDEWWYFITKPHPKRGGHKYNKT